MNDVYAPQRLAARGIKRDVTRSATAQLANEYAKQELRRRRIEPVPGQSALRQLENVKAAGKLAACGQECLSGPDQPSADTQWRRYNEHGRYVKKLKDTYGIEYNPTVHIKHDGSAVHPRSLWDYKVKQERIERNMRAALRVRLKRVGGSWRLETAAAGGAMAGGATKRKKGKKGGAYAV